MTTVCPSLMRTGSPRNAEFKGQHRKEYAWFSISDSLPVAAISAEQAAARILLGCQRGDAQVLFNSFGQFAVFASSLAPGWTHELLMLVDRLLPEMGGIGQRAAAGYQSQSILSPSWLTHLTERAARLNNEMRMGDTRPTRQAAG